MENFKYKILIMLINILLFFIILLGIPYSAFMIYYLLEFSSEIKFEVNLMRLIIITSIFLLIIILPIIKKKLKHMQIVTNYSLKSNEDLINSNYKAISSIINDKIILFYISKVANAMPGNNIHYNSAIAIASFYISDKENQIKIKMLFVKLLYLLTFTAPIICLNLVEYFLDGNIDGKIENTGDALIFMFTFILLPIPAIIAGAFIISIFVNKICSYIVKSNYDIEEVSFEYYNNLRNSNIKFNELCLLAEEFELNKKELI